MPRRYQEPRYRLEATIPLDLLQSINREAREAKQTVSRTVERLLKKGLNYSYEEQESESFKKDLETIKELERIRRATGL